MMKSHKQLTYGVIGCGLIVHLFFLITFWPVIHTLDSPGFLLTAHSALGDGAILIDQFQMPGYGIFLCGIFAIFGENLWVVAIIQHTILLLSTLLLLPSKTTIARPISYLPALLFAVHPAFSILGSLIMPEAIFSFLILASLVRIVAFLDEKSVAHQSLLLPGVGIGVATLLRGNGITILGVAFIVLFFAWVLQRRRDLVIALGFLMVGFCVAFLPIAILRMSDGTSGLFGRKGAYLGWLMETLLNRTKNDPRYLSNDEYKERFLIALKERSDPMLSPVRETVSFYQLLERRLRENYSLDITNKIYRSYILQYVLENSWEAFRDSGTLFLMHVGVVPPSLTVSISPGFDFTVAMLEDVRIGNNRIRDVLYLISASEIHPLIKQSGFISLSMENRLSVIVAGFRWIDWLLSCLVVYLILKNSCFGKLPINMGDRLLIAVYLSQAFLLAFLLRSTTRYSIVFWPLILYMLIRFDEKRKTVQDVRLVS